MGFYFEDLNGETPYNFIGNAKQNSTGDFNLNWVVPLNLLPGKYKIQFSGLTDHPLQEGNTESGTFIIK